MAECPVCGVDNPPEAVNCRSCQLSTSLFVPVREAAGAGTEAAPPDSDYARAIAEILVAVGPGPEESDRSSPEPAAGATLPPNFRFPNLKKPVGGSAQSPKAPSLPALPATPPGSDLTLLHRQVEELIQLGRREGLDLREQDQGMMHALRDENRAALEGLRRTLFLRVAAATAEDLDNQSGRRNELAPLVPTPTIDAELAGTQAAFDAGDLAGTILRLRHISEELSALEERWATCQILTAEADLMVETLRELGQDPEPALGPLAEGRRLARAGSSERAERVLAGANRALWGLLVPRLTESLQEIRLRIQAHSSSDSNIDPVVQELRQLAALIRRRNFGAVVTTYRRLRTAASALVPPAAA
jgi:hypothetical protein